MSCSESLWVSAIGISFFVPDTISINRLLLDVQVFKLRKTAGKRVRESVLQFDVFQQDVDEPACAVYKNFCH